MAYVENLGNNKHKIYVDVGYDSRGKRRRRTRTVTVTSNRDLNKKIRDFEFECMQQAEEPIENISFAGFVKRWKKNHVQVNLTASSSDTYDYVLKNNLLEYFGHMKLKDIRKFHIVEYFAKSEGEGLLPTKYMVLKSIFAKAVEWEVINNNPTKGIKEPKPTTKRKIRFYNEDELNHLFNVLDDCYPKHRVMIKLAAIGGLRRAEVAGIREESINFEKEYIFVDKQLRYSKNKGFYLSPVKNKKPRKVYLPTEFMNELKSYYIDFKSRKLAMGNLWNPLKINDEEINLLFVKEDGFPTHLNSISNEWRKIIDRYKLNSVSFHQLRHSCASLMVKKGVNFKIIQERLGHANIGITLDLYSHLEEEQHIEGANVFSDLL